MWIWQQDDWPQFHYNLNKIQPILEQTIKAIMPLVVLAAELDQNKQLILESQVLLDEALSSAKIEGEILDRESVRSSICNRLGIGQVSQNSRSAEAYIDMLLDCVRTSDQTLTENHFFRWHQLLFTEKPTLYNLKIGEYRTDTMQVISGHYGKQTVHFEAPCNNADCLQKEMTQLIHYLNENKESSPYIQAAIAKFWFVTIHPFDDGNGRLSRVLAERFLAIAENSQMRFYAISQQIEKNRKAYYEMLEQTQKGTLELTDWIIWFLQQVRDAALSSRKKLNKIRQATLFWDQHRHTQFNARQRKLITRLLETNDFDEGIARRKYKNLVNAADATAARDLKELLEKGILTTEGAGRSVKYYLA